jgi:hypothetical protein
MPAIYSPAEVLVFLPVRSLLATPEASACGTPVVTSNATHPGNIGDAAVLST